ncbi:MAG: LPXTG cell wall anchor domain-containing protein [Actinomycetales bacterium]|nr:LPXTG cell wall anchor domain-containing protein [Actinomycetales bacterium]
MQNEDSGTYVAGWVQMAFDFSAGNVANGAYVTIMDWSFNTGDVNTSITMPATGGSDAVPGIGGLAGLAMGAAGLRRKRQRVA